VVVQVCVGATPGPLSVVVQVVCDDGAELLDTSIHPAQHAIAATIATMQNVLLKWICIPPSLYLPLRSPAIAS
jgi:hypothetical protein